jgi:hypothetical protein
MRDRASLKDIGSNERAEYRNSRSRQLLEGYLDCFEGMEKEEGP